MNIKMKIRLLMLISLCVAVPAHAELTAEKLQNLIECKAMHKDFVAFGDEYIEGLKNLGWEHVDTPDQPFIYLYRNNKAVSFFGMPTKEIALASSALTAVYRDVDINKLSEKFDIPRKTNFIDNSVFRGEKIAKTEPATKDTFTYYNKLILSELPGQDPMTLLGCSYEVDEKEVNQSFHFDKTP